MSSENPQHPWESRLREVAKTAEEDVKRLVAYINDEVMPDIRRNSSSALRSASAELHKLAERMDDVHRKP
jgi:predicted DNA-binding ribbon-helix-helix protein